MIAALGLVVSGISTIGTLVLIALETCANAILVALAAAYAVAIGLLPSMPSLPSIGSPTWLGWLNWFYPVGSLLTGLAVIVALWVSFLVVRFILKLIRAL